MPVEAQAEFIQDAFAMGAFDTGTAPAYAGLRIRASDFGDVDDRPDYAAAFGPAADVDWSTMLRGAVEALHHGDFRR